MVGASVLGSLYASISRCFLRERVTGTVISSQSTILLVWILWWMKNKAICRLNSIFKTNHLTISAATGFAYWTDQEKNVVLVKVCPLIDGVTPLLPICVICSTCKESQGYQHLSGRCERHLYLSYKLNPIFRDLYLWRLSPEQSLRSWTMELIFGLDNEAGWKRSLLPIDSNIYQHLLSTKMCAQLWSQIVVTVVSLQRHTGSGAAPQTLPITDDLLLKLSFLLHSLVLRTLLSPLHQLGLINWTHVLVLCLKRSPKWHRWTSPCPGHVELCSNHL